MNTKKSERKWGFHRYLLLFPCTQARGLSLDTNVFSPGQRDDSGLHQLKVFVGAAKEMKIRKLVLYT